MFKHKNISSLILVWAVLFEKKFCIFKTNNCTNNSITFVYKSDSALPPLYLLTEVSKTFVVDSLCFRSSVTDTSVDTLYNYKWDFYVNILRESKNLQTSTKYFFNSLWLERELLETSNLTYKFLSDSRPLLLNYGDRTDMLVKHRSVTANFDLKTVWHGRRIVKFNAANVEI